MIELKSVRTPTNGDKIRAMSDEELALFLSPLMRGRMCTKENAALQHTLDWLHQPADDMSARGHENIAEVSQ